MRHVPRIRRCFVVAAAVALSVPMFAAAQERSALQLAVAVGPTLNDLEALNTIWAGVAALEWRPTSRLLVIDSSLRYAAYTPSAREHYLLPEVSWQLEGSLGAFRPFAGAGAGVAFLIRPGESAAAAAWHVTAGARVELGDRVGVRSEARLRSVEPIGDLTLGVTWRLNRGQS